MSDLTILGLAVPAVIAALLQGAKTLLGLSNRAAGWAAIIISLGVVGTAEAMNAWPQITPVVRVVLFGLLLGLATIGTYHVGKSVMGNMGKSGDGL